MRYPNGLFGWADVMTRDPGRAIEFYEGLFGWTHVDQPTPMGHPDQRRGSVDSGLLRPDVEGPHGGDHALEGT